MSMRKTPKGTKTFSEKEKLAILKETGERGLKLILEKSPFILLPFTIGKKI